VSTHTASSLPEEFLELIVLPTSPEDSVVPGGQSLGLAVVMVFTEEELVACPSDSALKVATKRNEDTKVGVLCPEEQLIRAPALIQYVLAPGDSHLQSKVGELIVGADVGSFQIADVVGSANDVELQFRHCSVLGSALKVGPVLKKAECLPEFRSLHVALSIGGSANTPDFSFLDVLDNLVDNGGASGVANTILNHPSLLVRHEVGDGFLCLLQVSAPCMDGRVVWSRIGRTVRKLLQKS